MKIICDNNELTIVEFPPQKRTIRVVLDYDDGYSADQNIEVRSYYLQFPHVLLIKDNKELQLYACLMDGPYDPNRELLALPLTNMETNGQVCLTNVMDDGIYRKLFNDAFNNFWLSKFDISLSRELLRFYNNNNEAKESSPTNSKKLINFVTKAFEFWQNSENPKFLPISHPADINTLKTIYNEISLRQ
jgi:hypothetical protein